MDFTSKYKWLFEYSKTLSKSSYYYKEEWYAYRFMLFDKMYGLFGIKDNKIILTLKGLPEENSFLINSCKSITPGYYMNKTHWYTIDLTMEEFSDEEIKKFLTKSYELIKLQLPKKKQNTI